MSDSAALLKFAQSISKVELHVHFEGSILPSTLLELGKRNAVDLPFSTPEELGDWFAFTDFAHFIEVYLQIVNCLKTCDDFEFAAYEFGRQMSVDKSLYAEVTFTLGLHHKVGPWQDVLAAANKGRARAKADFGVDWRWTIDIPRDFADMYETTTAIVIEAAEDTGIIALGLGGSEAGFAAHLFQTYFQRALKENPRITSVPHAGENAGAESVWDCINKLGATRIGHGVRSIEDDALIAHLKEHQIPLEVCPTSNIKLGVYPDYASHPLRKLWDAGAYVTVNSDDPPLFDCSLTSEYGVLVTEFGFNADMITKIAVNAARASRLPAEEKEALESKIVEGAKALRSELGL